MLPEQKAHLLLESENVSEKEIFLIFMIVFCADAYKCILLKLYRLLIPLVYR